MLRIPHQTFGSSDFDDLEGKLPNGRACIGVAAMPRGTRKPNHSLRIGLFGFYDVFIFGFSEWPDLLQGGPTELHSEIQFNLP